MQKRIIIEHLNKAVWRVWVVSAVSIVQRVSKDHLVFFSSVSEIMGWFLQSLGLENKLIRHKGSKGRESSQLISFNEMKTSFDYKHGLKFICESLRKFHAYSWEREKNKLMTHVCMSYKQNCHFLFEIALQQLKSFFTVQGMFAVDFVNYIKIFTFQMIFQPGSRARGSFVFLQALIFHPWVLPPG